MRRDLLDEDWDFRQITEGELEFVLLWEYARESKIISKIIDRWLCRSVNGKTLREHLRGKSLPPFEPEVSGELHRHKPSGRSGSKLAQMIIDLPSFPTPWLAFDRDYILDHVQRWGAVDPYYMATITPERLFKVEQNSATHGVCGYVMSIDYNHPHFSVEAAVEYLRKKILKEVKRRGVKVKTGRGALPDYKKLKWLAARRLHVRGIRHIAAKAMAEVQRKQVELDNCGDVLPVYESAGAWVRAVRQADRELKAFEKQIT
jgi:hypothetical protein